MKLLTKEIQKKLPKLFATEDIPTEDKIFVTKFFTPDSYWTWYIVEGEQTEDGNWEFFGFVEGFEREWGYFDSRSLEAARGPLGLNIERDKFFNDVPAKEILKPSEMKGE